ncbi:hypothetical protein [Tropicibacter sp. S64]|uniref:hypothetical protein n=1 Tax=Tropicibacter sp. S64 TaxID=3415122 RepID=UPI003C7A7A7D
MKRSQLLLPPAGDPAKRIWITLPIGAHAEDSAARAIESPAQPITVVNPSGDLATFATALPVLRAVQRRLAGVPVTPDLGSVIAAMEEACQVEARLDASGGLEQAAQQNGDALAALRRISRESAESSTLIDRAARSLNAALSRLDISHVVILNAERIDRPTLKMLARACLIDPAEARTIWIWTEARLPAPTAASSFAARLDLPQHARRGILAAIRAVLDPVQHDEAADQTLIAAPKPRKTPDFGIGGATGRLANLNYDGAADWVAQQTKPDVDTCRLAALLMVNLGLNDAAIDTLAHAVTLNTAPTLRCHMWYVSGLIWSKRRYNVARSNRCFDLAEAALEQAGPDDPGDPAMERAWVHNGRAMNAVLAARFAGQPIKDAFPVAFDHLRRASDLVREGRSRDRVYLRYNLLGNMSNLMEIGGNHPLALDLLNRTFDESLAKGSANEREWLAQQRCMRAALMARAGDAAFAAPVFAEARALMQETDRPIGAEALARSQATALYQSGDLDAARAVFATGIGEARALRSRLGLETHLAGLAACDLALGREQDALSILEQIGKEEDVWPVDAAALARRDLSGLRIRDTYYGLSLSIPEVDLEDMAPASIAGALRGRASEVASARAVER